MRTGCSKLARLTLGLIALAAATPALAADSDHDGWLDAQDNCVQRANVSQCDTDHDGFGNACDGDFDQSHGVNAHDFTARFVPDWTAGIDSGAGTDMDCDGVVGVRDYFGLFRSQYTVPGAPGPSGLACAGTPGCTATGPGPARVAVLETPFFVEPEAIIESAAQYEAAPALQTVFHSRRIVDAAGEVMQGADDPDDVMCPVDFATPNVARTPLPSEYQGSAPTYPWGSFELQANAGAQTSSDTVAYLGVRPHFSLYFAVGVRDRGTVLAHEWGHRRNLRHTVELEPGEIGYGKPSIMGGLAGVGDRETSVLPEQCVLYVEMAESRGGPALSNCLIDPDLADPGDAYEAAPAWAPCTDGSGFCDGHGRCFEGDLECFEDGVGPEARGTDCTRGDGVCRACDGSGACVPCDTNAERQSARAHLYTTGPGASGARSALIRIGMEAPFGLFDRGHETVLALGRDVVALTGVNDGSLVFYGVAPDPPGNDLLLRVDAIAETVDVIGSLATTGVHDLTLRSDGASALLYAVRDVGGASRLLRIEVGATGVAVTDVGAIGSFRITGLAWTPVAERLEALGIFEAGSLQLITSMWVDASTAATSNIAFEQEAGDGEQAMAFDPITNEIARSFSSAHPDFAIDAPYARALTPVCGNGLTERGESCDDGNVYDGDGCTAACATATAASGAFSDPDGDGHPNYQDVCPLESDPLQTDSDADGDGDACEFCPSIPDARATDLDADGVPDACDNAPRPNADQLDTDGDGRGDVSDNCPSVHTYHAAVSLLTDQADADADGIGDACDSTPDGDFIEADDDNCPWDYNPGQQDVDGDGRGDACDLVCPYDGYNDADGDGLCYLDANGTLVDNCPTISNPVNPATGRQDDRDADGYGDRCDVCHDVPDPDQRDSDGDGEGDACDNCPSVANGNQADSDGDGIGDVCEADVDGDGILPDADNCPLVANAGQQDQDADAIGDACDPDRDGDGVLEDSSGIGVGGLFCGLATATGAYGPPPYCDDNCPAVPNADQANADGDELGDACDP